MFIKHMKSFSLAVALAASLSVIPTISQGASPPSSYSGRSSSSYSSGSSSYSKPGMPAPRSESVSPSSSSGYSKPMGMPTSPVPPQSFSKPGGPSSTSVASPSPNSSLSGASNRSNSTNAAATYNSTRTPPVINQAQVRQDPVYRSATSAWGGDTRRYTAQRTVVVTSYRSSHPDIYIMTGNMYPHYGMYDSSFLTGMVMGYVGMSIAQNSMWMYAQQSQPWYPSYRADLEVQAQNNVDLRNKLAAMDAEIAQLKANGQAPVANGLPQGVDPALAMAPEAVLDQPSSGIPWYWFLLGVLLAGGIIYVVMRRK